MIVGSVHFDVSVDEDQRNLSGDANAGPDDCRDRKMTLTHYFCYYQLLVIYSEKLVDWVIANRSTGNTFSILRSMFENQPHLPNEAFGVKLKTIILSLFVQKVNTSDFVPTQLQLTFGNVSDVPLADFELPDSFHTTNARDIVEPGSGSFE
ncbi:hypothetical protein KIN20_019610 [Parelaphostrongylus tenuis]|uniref:Uncharacterized protein n=1 Tax=Parelaphostrongylus tenuis TaxID=148309 RepID=A0AAD5MLF4_PARTN|nr:hypothetical protein KIN20_019610 [Parelaphostrongylus tenuis]